jgi:TonB family protein
MKTYRLIPAALLVACSCASASITRVEIDPGAYHFLRRVLVSGGDFSYPDEAAKARHSGTASYDMVVAEDGRVGSLRLASSSGHAAIDAHVARTLKGYRFKPGTKGPLRWHISFFWPSKIKVILTRSRPSPPQPARERR